MCNGHSGSSEARATGAGSVVLNRRTRRRSAGLGGLLWLGGGGVMLSDVWEGCYPASALAPTCGVLWVEWSIMTSVYECWFSSTLHIGWGLCDSLCLVLLCGGRYGLGGGVLLTSEGSSVGLCN